MPLMQLFERAAQHLVEEALDSVVQHLEITRVEDNPRRVAILEHDLAAMDVGHPSDPQVAVGQIRCQIAGRTCPH